WIHSRRSIVQRAGMRITAFALQSDFNRNFLEVAAGQTPSRHFCMQAQHVLLTDVEIYVNWVDLHYSGEQAGHRRAADELALGNLPCSYDAVERRFHVCVLGVEGGELSIGLGLEKIGLCSIAVGEREVVLLSAYGSFRHQGRKAVEI